MSESEGLTCERAGSCCRAVGGLEDMQLMPVSLAGPWPRSARSDQPWKHVFHELHCPGTHPHATLARLLPV